MRAVLVKRGLEGGEQALGLVRRKSVRPKTRDQLFLLNDMPLALGDMLVGLENVGSRVCHGCL